MNKKDYESNIKTIMDITKCSRKIAEQCLNKTQNLNNAISLAHESMKSELYVGGGSSGLAVESAKRIVEYKDGLLVQDKFYSYDDEKNKELKSMLERKEFDASLLGGHDNENMSVVYEDRKYMNYEQNKKKPEEKKKIKYPKVGVSLDLPDNMVIEEGNVKFRILTSDKRINVTMKDGKIKDVVKYINKKCNRKVRLLSGNKVLDENEDVKNIDRTMVVLEIIK